MTNLKIILATLILTGLFPVGSHAQVVPEFTLPCPVGEEKVIFSCDNPDDKHAYSVYSLKNAYLEEIKASGAKEYRVDICRAKGPDNQGKCYPSAIIVAKKNPAGNYAVTVNENIKAQSNRSGKWSAKTHLTYNDKLMLLEDVSGQRSIRNTRRHNFLTNVALLHLFGNEPASVNSGLTDDSIDDCLKRHPSFTP